MNNIAFFCLFLISIFITEIKSSIDVNLRHHAFDLHLYEDVLDSEKCEKELNYIFQANLNLGFRFRNAGIRIPRGLAGGNFMDLGNYHECLGIREDVEDLNIQGKYCLLNIPFNQKLNFPVISDNPTNTESLEYFWGNLNTAHYAEDLKLEKINDYINKTSGLFKFKGSKTVRSNEPELSGLSLTVGTCVPKSCTTNEYFKKVLFLNISNLGLQYNEVFCRLPDDKPWAPVDYVAIVIFSLIGLLVLLSTCYDVHYTVILQKDPKEANVIYQSFSIYTNTQRLFVFTSNSKTIESLDGIRALSMMWVILGHTASTMQIANILETWEWILSLRSLWLSAATISVDTFFFLSGLLLVYTSCGKFSSSQLIKKLHLFYLHRLLRMFPLLAAVILAQASFLNRIDDGPAWIYVSNQVETCRKYWWSTLLYIQNYVNPREFCLGQSWYLSVDVQLHILSPLILVWVFMKKESHLRGWIALVAALIISLTSSTIYNAIKKFGSTVISIDSADYMINYYINTLTRASPLFMGMIFGYILYTLQGKKLKLSKALVTIMWLFIAILYSLVLYAHYAPIQEEWNNKIGDIVINSFMRPTWGCALGLMIVLCTHGYGGFINWLLSHKTWKLPSRVSYAMYLIHFQLMLIGLSTRLHPTHFTPNIVFAYFLSYVTLTLLISIMATVLVDSPFANIIKLIMGQGNKKPYPTSQITEIDREKEVENGIADRQQAIKNMSERDLTVNRL